MASQNNPKGRQNDIVLQQIKDEVIIYDLTINKVYSLNETSALVWNLCDGNNSVADISNQLSKKLKQPVTDDLVWLALDQFKEDNLLSDNEKVEIKFDGLSRREVIRKVGLASMIAIPIITSIVAPTAVTAQSCAPNGAACSPSNLTQANCCNSNQRCNGAICNTCFAAGIAVSICSGSGCCATAPGSPVCCSSTFSESSTGNPAPNDIRCSCT